MIVFANAAGHERVYAVLRHPLRRFLSHLTNMYVSSWIDGRVNAASLIDNITDANLRTFMPPFAHKVQDRQQATLLCSIEELISYAQARIGFYGCATSAPPQKNEIVAKAATQQKNLSWFGTLRPDQMQRVIRAFADDMELWYSTCGSKGSAIW